MDPLKLPEEFKKRSQVSVDRFKDELKKIRTGRANAAMLDGIMVEAYGVSMPINQLASISVPEATMIQLSPFDPNNLAPIVEAVKKQQTLGLNPMDDGRVIRLQIPPLTEERRREIAKQLNEKVEECLISVRNHRHEILKQADNSQKEKKITKDDYDQVEKQVNGILNSQRQTIEDLKTSKETEIMTV